MKVSLNEIKEAFDSLINESKSREEVADWAVELMSAYDHYELEFYPPSEKMKIIKGIVYLTGVDLLDIDDSYFHSIENFIQYMNEKGI